MISDFPYVAMNKDERCYPTVCHQITTAEECAYAVSYASTLGFDNESKNATLITGNFAKLPIGCSAIGGLHRDDIPERDDVIFFFNNYNGLVDNESDYDANLESFLAEAAFFTTANYDSNISKNVKMILHQKKGTNSSIYFE